MYCENYRYQKGGWQHWQTTDRLIETPFEDYLVKIFGGTGNFSVGGREFDGCLGNKWWEAKSGDYWSMIFKQPEKMSRFKSTLPDCKKIANDYGATYELFSNTPIPESIKEWLTQKGIPFTEILF